MQGLKEELAKMRIKLPNNQAEPLPIETAGSSASADQIRLVLSPAEASDLSPLLLDIKGLAKLLSRSVGSLWRDDAAGRLPRAVRIGSSKRWRFDEIRDWVSAGCPSRSDWEAIRAR